MFVSRCGWLVLLFSLSSMAQDVVVDHLQSSPAANQKIVQPGDTSFEVNNNGVATTTFTDPLTYHIQALSPGVLSQETITGYKPNILGYDLWTPKLTCAGPSHDISGIWSECKLMNSTFTTTQRGIAQKFSGLMASYGIGDRAIHYDYATFFGGVQVFNDEGITVHATHAVQNGYLAGPVTSGGTGVTLLEAKVACRSAGGESCSYSTGNYFNDGGIVYNQSQGRAAKVIRGGSQMDGLYLDVAGIELPKSTAWGNVASCTNNGPGQFQLYTSTTCKIKLGTDPASPGSFVAGQDVFLSGPFEEEAKVTAVGAVAGGLQAVTFSTRYFWNIGVPTIVMQGGPGGEALVQDPKWPIAWAVVGAFSSTRLVYSNCHLGYCNSMKVSGVTPKVAGTNSFHGTGRIVRTKGVATFTYSASNTDVASIYEYPKGSTVVLSGWTPVDLNGTYTVTFGSMDAGSPSIQWAQEGTDETSSAAGIISHPLVNASIYPAAFITGTDGGKIGVAQLGTNTVTFGTSPSGKWSPKTSYAVGYTLVDSNGHEQIVTKAGVSGERVPGWRTGAGVVEDNEVVWSYVGAPVADVVVGAPTSEYQQTGIQYYATQATPSDPYSPSKGISVVDSGPSPISSLYEGINDPKNGAAYNFFRINGSFDNVFHMQFRPANNGSIIYVAGSEPVSANAKPYYLFRDNQTFATIQVRPGIGGFMMEGGLSITNGALHLDTRYGRGLFLDGIVPGTAPLCLNGPGGQVTNVGCGSGAAKGATATSSVVVQVAKGAVGKAIQVQREDGKVVADVDSAGNVDGTNGTFSGVVRSGQYMGPVSAPLGTCSMSGAWVFSQDGHATFCANGTWVTKI